MNFILCKLTKFSEDLMTSGKQTKGPYHQTPPFFEEENLLRALATERYTFLKTRPCNSLLPRGKLLVKQKNVLWSHATEVLV